MNRMPAISMVFGVLLDVAGVVAFVATGSEHKTALLPCVFGIVIFICGLVAMKPNLLKHAMHVAAVFALLGFLAGAGRSIVVLAASGFEGNGLKIASTGSLTILCGLYLACCVKSFIEARKARLQHA